MHEQVSREEWDGHKEKKLEECDITNLVSSTPVSFPCVSPERAAFARLAKA